MPDNPTPSVPPTEGELINEARALIPDDLSWCPYTATGIEQLRQRAAQFGITCWALGRDASDGAHAAEIAQLKAEINEHVRYLHVVSQQLPPTDSSIQEMITHIDNLRAIREPAPADTGGGE